MALNWCGSVGRCEEVFGTHCTDTVMRAGEGEGPHPRKMKEAITVKLDREMRLASCSQADRAPVVADIARVIG